MPVLDTDFLIALEHHDAAADSLLRRIVDQPLVVPSIVVAEFLTGHASQAQPVLERIQEDFTVVHTSPEWVVAAATVRRDRRGKARVRMADAWIGAFARLHDTYVVTRNTRDYEVLGIPTESW